MKPKLHITFPSNFEEKYQAYRKKILDTPEKEAQYEQWKLNIEDPKWRKDNNYPPLTPSLKGTK